MLWTVLLLLLLLFSRPPQLFATPWTAARQDSLSLTTSQSLPKFMSITSVTPSSHLTLWCPLSFCPQSFLASGTFPVNYLYALDDQNTRASTSASVLPVNIQDWSPLRLTGLISLVSKRFSGVLYSTTVCRYQVFGVLPSLRSSYHNRTWPLGTP